MSKAVPFATTLEIRDACLCLCLHAQRAARALARRFDEALRLVGLTNGQFSLPISLNRPQPPAMDRTTLTAALKPLDRRGLVAIGVDPDDRRSRLLIPTDAGHATLAAAVPIWRETHAVVEAGLPTIDAGDLRAALCALA